MRVPKRHATHQVGCHGFGKVEDRYALKNGMRIVDDAGSDRTLKQVVKRRVKEAAKDFINRLLAGGSNSSGSGSGIE